MLSKLFIKNSVKSKPIFTKSTKRTYFSNKENDNTYAIPARLIARTVSKFEKHSRLDIIPELPPQFSTEKYMRNRDIVISLFYRIEEDVCDDVIITKVLSSDQSNEYEGMNLLFFCISNSQLPSIKVNEEQFTWLKENTPAESLIIKWCYEYDTKNVYTIESIINASYAMPKVIVCGDFPEYTY